MTIGHKSEQAALADRKTVIGLNPPAFYDA